MKISTLIIIGSTLLSPISMFADDTPPREIWNSKCAICHGVDGSGKTKIGKKLMLKDYTPKG